MFSKIYWMLLISLAVGLRVAGAAQFYAIPSLDDTAHATSATGVSQDGRVVVGWSDTDQGIRAIRWTIAGGPQSLGAGFMPGSMERVSQSTAISGDGNVIAGWTHYFDQNAWITRKMAFIWTEAEGFDTFPASSGNSYIPNAVSYDGNVIVGDVLRGTTPAFAVIFHRDESIETIAGTSPYTQTRAIGVSHDGMRIAGTGLYYDTRRSFLRDETQGFQFIGETGPDHFTSATALSADGQIVAGMQGATDSTVFRWSTDSGIVDVGELQGSLNTQVRALNETGQLMVGRAGVPGNWEAVIWSESDGFQKLSDFIEQNLSLNQDLQEWQLSQANAITKYALVGDGIDPNGRQKGWLILLNIFGDADEDRDVDGYDLFQYINGGDFSTIDAFAMEYARQ